MRKINKTQAIANYLIRYGGINHQTAYAQFKTFALPQAIDRLRARGMKIEYDSEKNRYLLVTHQNNIR